MFEIYNPWGTRTGSTQDWDTTFQVSLGTLLADKDVISVASKTVPQPLSGSAAPLLPTTTQAGSSLGLASAFS